MSKQGSSLIETMVAMILLMIIALSSAFYFAIPPFRKEARRFAALERAYGMMDLIFFAQKTKSYSRFPSGFQPSFYKINDCPTNSVNPLVEFKSGDTNLLPLTISTNMPPVWYTFKVAAATTVVSAGSGVLEAEIKLYDDRLDTNSIFATFKMLLPPNG